MLALGVDKRGPRMRQRNLKDVYKYGYSTSITNIYKLLVLLSFYHKGVVARSHKLARIPDSLIVYSIIGRHKLGSLHILGIDIIVSQYLRVV